MTRGWNPGGSMESNGRNGNFLGNLTDFPNYF